MAEQTTDPKAGPSNNNVARSPPTFGEPTVTWLDTIYYDDNADEEEESTRSVQILDIHARKYVWWMSSVLEIYINGVAPQAVQILERYLAIYLRMDNPTYAAVEERKRSMPVKIPMFVATALWLAIKISGESDQRKVNAAIICEKLRQNSGIDCTVEDIKTTEIEIYSSINYRIPVWSTVEKANILAKLVGFTEPMRDNVESMVQLAEYHRHAIQNYVIMMAKHSQQHQAAISTGNIRNAHFCAAVVIAVSISIDNGGPQTEKILKELAKLSKSNEIYLKTIAQGIVLNVDVYGNQANEVPQIVNQPKKRKSDMEESSAKRTCM